MKKFNIGDEVVFRNIFALISGRIYSFRENKNGEISGCSIKTLDSKFNTVTYQVRAGDVLITVLGLDDLVQE